jgi:hypothetical protein
LTGAVATALAAGIRSSAASAANKPSAQTSDERHAKALTAHAATGSEPADSANDETASSAGAAHDGSGSAAAGDALAAGDDASEGNGGALGAKAVEDGKGSKSSESSADHASSTAAAKSDAGDEGAAEGGAESKRDASAGAVAKSGTGTLRINSRPWAQVIVDGKVVGNTPQLGLQLRAGKHKVKLVNEPMAMSKTIRVWIAPGETQTQILNLSE